MQVSGLEEEFELAQARGLPRLLYVKTPAPHREPRLAGLLDRIKREGADSNRYFRTTAELGRLVRDDLATLLSERFVATHTAVADPAPAPAQSTPRGRGPRPLPVGTTSLVGRGHGVFLVALGLWIIGMGVLGWRQGRPQAQPRSLRRQVPAHLLSQDEKLLAATLAVSGPPFDLLWVPLALGASMMLAAGPVGDWLGVAGIVTVGLGGPLALVVFWRPVGVVLTDRRLIVSRTTRFGRFRKVLLDAPRSQAAVQEARAGIVLWGALEFVVCVDAATGHAPIRLTFWRPPAQQQGRTIDAALSHPQAGGG
jgi:hypothetical protein